ncbi:MAG: hypothetical protein J0H85_07085 [Sediminibacterium magnilacihabitans]|jgi:hypothetical protein|nr:hypothetical protein [Sediminibacterium magnilacihabitans]PQV61071.1 hypothetical protein CLV53_104168 [Sediminibacterium magnilacihabitans]
MKKAFAGLTDKQIAESFVLPVKLSIRQQAEASAQLATARAKSLEQAKPVDKLLARILQLRFQLEDYLKSESYQPTRTFGHFLKEYQQLGGKKRKEFAYEINIHETLLSQLISDRREPGEQIFIRLELHSNKTIPASYWFRLVEKKKAYQLQHDSKIRQREKKNVKKSLALQEDDLPVF